MLSRQLKRDIRKILADGIRSGKIISTDFLPAFLEDVTERIFFLEWSSGGMGGSGTVTVSRLGRWYLTSDADFGWDGPFETLDEALGGIFVSEATGTIWCTELSDEEIIARMDLQGQPSSLVINGSEWPFERIEHVYEQSREA